MRIYQTDGTSVDHSSDTAFGWFLPQLLDREVFVCENNVKTSTVAFTERTIVCENVDEKTLNVDVPLKTELVALIDATDPESRTLLSIIHHKEHRTIEKEKSYSQTESQESSVANCDYKNSTSLMSELILRQESVLKNRHSERKTSLRELHAEIQALKLDFQLEENRVSRLKSEARKLAEDIRESAHLDRMLYLLSGKPDKVQALNWPFKLCRSKKSDGDSNLIV